MIFSDFESRNRHLPKRSRRLDGIADMNIKILPPWSRAYTAQVLGSYRAVLSIPILFLFMLCSSAPPSFSQMFIILENNVSSCVRACVYVCTHFGGVRRPENGIFWGSTVHMNKVLFMWVVRKNLPALGHDRKVIFPMQVFFAIAL